MADGVHFDLPHELMGKLCREHIVQAFPEQIVPGARWSFSIMIENGIYFGRLEMVPRHSGQPVEGTPLEIEPAGAATSDGEPFDIQGLTLTHAQRLALATIDAAGRDCYRRNRLAGASHSEALTIARDDMAIRASAAKRRTAA